MHNSETRLHRSAEMMHKSADGLHKSAEPRHRLPGGRHGAANGRHGWSAAMTKAGNRFEQKRTKRTKVRTRKLESLRFLRFLLLPPSLRTIRDPTHSGLRSIRRGFSFSGMFWRRFSFIVLLAALASGCSTVKKFTHRSAPADPLAAFQARAAKYHSIVTVPTFETTPDAVKATVDKTIADGNAALDSVGQLQAERSQFCQHHPPTRRPQLSGSTRLGPAGPDRADQHQRRRARRGDGRHQETFRLVGGHGLSRGCLCGGEGLRGHAAGAGGRGQKTF